ncbi:hypothetical protein [Vibrio gazogenes]|uniref:Uncharacterized protein n=1 Tax=Vibrio gazogenes DSM 21264 = NBRC 103151 TaxID=1123492 RepID=A0A1M5FLN9_VIBGA|nr:hypothetical protein [Vibrio gazogenes]USP14486.1 hypothetical protein MKS89_03970 [Vibrio gazogenes]SHF92405.1 hypothetical protein SAMN02745781_03523 [Vibrio gazogenes DSM 21264] [Vibrio gazogenes DSM 21264 = NBRC 103151]SJN57628.1 hypothetical protein BQ6471_02634 [Vibrio gazogenes]
MQFLKKLFANHAASQVNENQADAIHQDILQLEERYAAEPDNIALQQTLLVKYTQAASVYAQVPSYKNNVNDVFNKMNELRNTARKNF